MLIFQALTSRSRPAGPDFLPVSVLLSSARHVNRETKNHTCTQRPLQPPLPPAGVKYSGQAGPASLLSDGAWRVHAACVRRQRMQELRVCAEWKEIIGVCVDTLALFKPDFIKCKVLYCQAVYGITNTQAPWGWHCTEHFQRSLHQSKCFFTRGVPLRFTFIHID